MSYDANELRELGGILEELWDYGFNSNGDFPTEHVSKWKRVKEAELAITAQTQAAYKQGYIDGGIEQLTKEDEEK